MRLIAFGATSLDGLPAFRRARDVVATPAGTTPVVLASALCGAEQALLAAAREAVAGRAEAAFARVAELEERHRAVVEALGAGGDAGRRIGELFLLLRGRIEGILLVGELPQRTRAGLAAVLEAAGGALLAAATGGALLEASRASGNSATDPRSGSEHPARLPERVAALLAAGRPVVVAGLLAAPGDGVVRLARSLDVPEIELFGEEDGIMTADPSLVADAAPLPDITFPEALELARFGPLLPSRPALRSAGARGIPIVVRSLRRPGLPGTRVADAPASSRGGARAVVLSPSAAVVRISHPRIASDTGYGARVFSAFDRQGLEIGLLSASDTSISCTVAAEAPGLGAALRELAGVGTVELQQEHAVVAVVGEGIARSGAVVARIFDAVEDLHVAVSALGASARSIAMALPEREGAVAVQRLHARLVVPPPPRLCGLLRPTA